MKRAPRYVHVAAAICLSVAAIIPAPTAQAAQAETIHVDTTEFAAIANFNCDLMEALQAAKLDDPVDGCETGGNLLPDIIAFDIGGGGEQTIVTGSPVNVDSPVYISGGSQAGYAGVPLIKIASTTTPAMQFTAAAAGSTIRAMQVSSNHGGAMVLNILADDVTVIANYIGTDGASLLTNGTGVTINGSTGSHIGGPTSEQRNLIGTKLGIGIIDGDGNTVEGNYLGVTAGGNALLTGIGPAYYGIQLRGSEAHGNTLRGNVVSGAYTNAILIEVAAHDNTVVGNIIGLGADGVSLLGNDTGIHIEGGSDNIIGGSTAADRNVISGNAYNISIQDYIDGSTTVADGNIIRGNYIGTTASGMSASNPTDISGINLTGIKLISGNQTLIGGIEAGHANIISDNQTGIYVNDDATGTQVLSNKIGTDAVGMGALGNSAGILVVSGASVMVGDEATPGNNLISGNNSSGVSLGADATATIQGNRIGLGAHGDAALGNLIGISLNSGSGAVIAENWIAHNAHDGVDAYANASIEAGSIDNCISANGIYGALGFSPLAGSLAGNWWGSPTGPTHESNPGGTGDAVSDAILYSPFLTEAPAPCQRAPSDFDGDGRTDPAKFFPATGMVWWYRTSDEVWDGTSLGMDTSSYVPRSDFDGDGMVDPAKYVAASQSLWYTRSSDAILVGEYMGPGSYSMLPGSDFDGDGMTDPAKYLVTGSIWWLPSTGGSWLGTFIGADASPALPGSDYDGDGQSDLAKYVPAAGAIWYLKSSTGTWQGTYIGSDGTPIPASDFDGDGITDMAKVLTGSNNLWYRRSSTGTWVGVYLGPGTFTYVTAADFDRDGKTDPTKFDAGSQSMWYLSSISGLWDGMYMGSGAYVIVN